MSFDHAGQPGLKKLVTNFLITHHVTVSSHRVKASEALSLVFSSVFGLDPQRILRCLKFVLQHLICETITL